MNRVALLVVMLTGVGCAAESPPAPDLASVLERHAAARGGREALEGLESLSVEVEIVEPEFTVIGHYVATWDGWMRIDVYAGGERVFTEALGPGGGWQMHADGIPIDLSEEGERALRQGIYGNLYGLHELARFGFEQTLRGLAQRNGREVWEIEQVAPDGESKRILVDAESYLITGEIETAALHPDVDPTETQQETSFSEFASFEGLVFATRHEKVDLDSGKVLQETRVRGLRRNEALDPARFQRPATSPE